MCGEDGARAGPFIGARGREELTGARQGARRRSLERLREEGSEDGWCCVAKTVLEWALL